MGLAGGVIFIDEERGIGLVLRAIQINSPQVANAVNAGHGYTSVPKKTQHRVRISSRADHISLWSHNYSPCTRCPSPRRTGCVLCTRRGNRQVVTTYAAVRLP